MLYKYDADAHMNLQSGSQLNIPQTNCPDNLNRPCPDSDPSKCTCPPDATGAAGVLINFYDVHSCTYLDGPCFYDEVIFSCSSSRLVF